MELHWQHSVEKVEWQERYQLQPQGLILQQSRIQGSGAGMEPGPEAVWQDGWWVSQWQRPVGRLTLPDSAFTEPMQLCVDGQCQPLRQWMETGSNTQTVVIGSGRHCEPGD
ncbi:DUF1850 domain-containing protein [Balneatrix alpica]|uniref:DUF1850 domain-containing protein n=2 Tax=Balneatrix alpica TaxID=75684 RepID=A0ABV5ZEK9_9GAMM